MQKKRNDCLEITDLKDMLNKTKKLYENNIAYKIRNEKDYITFTHKQVREMIDSLRNKIN